MARETLPRYISAKEVAALFGVCTEHIYRLHKRGLLPGVRLGRVLRFSREAVHALAMSADAACARARALQGSNLRKTLAPPRLAIAIAAERRRRARSRPADGGQ
jgi:excisionase family DNA binding protein